MSLAKILMVQSAASLVLSSRIYIIAPKYKANLDSCGIKSYFFNSIFISKCAILLLKKCRRPSSSGSCVFSPARGVAWSWNSIIQVWEMSSVYV